MNYDNRLITKRQLRFNEKLRNCAKLMKMLCFLLMRGQYSHTCMLNNSLFILTNQSAPGWMYNGCVNIYYREETYWPVYITMSIISTAPVCLQTVKILKKNSPKYGDWFRKFWDWCFTTTDICSFTILPVGSLTTDNRPILNIAFFAADETTALFH